MRTIDQLHDIDYSSWTIEELKFCISAPPELVDEDNVFLWHVDPSYPPGKFARVEVDCAGDELRNRKLTREETNVDSKKSIAYRLRQYLIAAEYLSEEEVQAAIKNGDDDGQGLSFEEVCDAILRYYNDEKLEGG